MALATALLGVVSVAVTSGCRGGGGDDGRSASKTERPEVPAPAEPRPEPEDAGPQVQGLGEPRPEPERVLAEGEQAPPLVLPDLAGAAHDLAAYRGRVVVLNVWASWCAPCVKELPSLQRLHETADEGLAVVTVSVDEYRFTTQDLVERAGLTAPVLLDPAGKKLAAWGTLKYPETWVLDREGRVADRILGARDWASAETRKLLAGI